MKEKIKKILKSIFALPLSMGFIVGLIVLLFLGVAIWGYIGGFLMYIFEIFIVAAFVATPICLLLYYLLKLVPNEKLNEEKREGIVAIIGVLVIVGVVVLEIIALQKGGGFFQNYLDYLGDMPKY